ncbi:hypothetical protein LARI1_G001246 [Lachnellula arida]|uniref:Uncharacterized protein n=1 Tax=Lachnellula arida TaxID=1316785 RepID=A0A8T9BNZ0_9HELO|nr:hypothetical protein LARI1_G001246 [Lachnellula arida]
MDAPPPYYGKTKVPPLDDRALTTIVYNNLDTPSQHPPIDADDTPQWEWTKAQCQEWFFELLTTKMGYAAVDADAVATKLDGFGPNIYLRMAGTWAELLENEEEGLAVYVWVLERRDREGGVPNGIVLKHGRALAR